MEIYNIMGMFNTDPEQSGKKVVRKINTNPSKYVHKNKEYLIEMKLNFKDKVNISWKLNMNWNKTINISDPSDGSSIEFLL